MLHGLQKQLYTYKHYIVHIYYNISVPVRTEKSPESLQIHSSLMKFPNRPNGFYLGSIKSFNII